MKYLDSEYYAHCYFDKGNVETTNICNHHLCYYGVGRFITYSLGTNLYISIHTYHDLFDKDHNSILNKETLSEKRFICRLFRSEVVAPRPDSDHTLWPGSVDVAAQLICPVHLVPLEYWDLHLIGSAVQDSL